MNVRRALSVAGVSRRFGGIPAVDRVSFDVDEGEFFSLLGPSGCGKTTTLRLIAGFEDPEPDGGTIRIFDTIVNGTRPYQRPIGMVFQNYALFPHLDIAANVAFGLVERRVACAEIAERVDRMLELVRLDPAAYRRRRPSELSGGQRQRVALARALVLEPRILLLDEPLGALDLQLRREMQLELRALNRRLGITFILVTHDQQEALVMSDRIAVMSAGRVAQVGSPGEIYERPRTRFVAEFIGDASFLGGKVERTGGGIATVTQAPGICWEAPASPAIRVGSQLRIAVRPERLSLHQPGDGVAAGVMENRVEGVVAERIFLGASLHVVVHLSDGTPVRVAVHDRSPTEAWVPGQRVVVSWRPHDAQVLEE